MTLEQINIRKYYFAQKIVKYYFCLSISFTLIVH